MYNASIGKDVNIDGRWFMYNVSIGEDVNIDDRCLCIMIIRRCDCCGRGWREIDGVHGDLRCTGQ